MNVEKELLELKERVSKLEGKQGNACCMNRKEIELEIEWPEAQIEGLKFIFQKTKSVFELKEDGNYYSRDILIHSARDTYNSSSCDLLSKYLESDNVRLAFDDALKNVGISAADIHIFLPEENQGLKKYNGVLWWYWLKPCPDEFKSVDRYYFVSYNGQNYDDNAYVVGGVAPAFFVA